MMAVLFSWIFLSKSSHDVIFGFLLLGRGEHFFAVVIFDQFALQEEGGVIGGAGGLLHGVRDEDDGVFFFQLQQGGFYFACGDGVKTGGWFI